MAKKKAGGGKGNALGNVTDYRHDDATRVNIPPAKIGEWYAVLYSPDLDANHLVALIEIKHDSRLDLFRLKDL